MKANRFLALSLVFFLGCARENAQLPPSEKEPASSASRADIEEAEIGRQIHENIVSTFRVYTEPRLVEYVSEIGESLARVAERHDLSYRFTVLYDDRLYAAGAPGGFIYITTGFLDFLQNEAELASLLAHEIGELQYRDPRLSPSRRAVTRVAQTGMVVAPAFGQIGALAALGLVLLDALAGAKEVETQGRVLKADRRALHYLVEAGQDPQGYLDLLGRLKAVSLRESPFAYDYLVSRPITPERYHEVLKAFEELPLEEKSFKVNRERYLEMTKGVREMYR